MITWIQTSSITSQSNNNQELLQNLVSTTLIEVVKDSKPQGHQLRIIKWTRSVKNTVIRWIWYHLISWPRRSKAWHRALLNPLVLRRQSPFPLFLWSRDNQTRKTCMRTRIKFRYTPPTLQLLLKMSNSNKSFLIPMSLLKKILRSLGLLSIFRIFRKNNPRAIKIMRKCSRCEKLMRKEWLTSGGELSDICRSTTIFSQIIRQILSSTTHSICTTLWGFARVLSTNASLRK